MCVPCWTIWNTSTNGAQSETPPNPVVILLVKMEQQSNCNLKNHEQQPAFDEAGEKLGEVGTDSDKRSIA